MADARILVIDDSPTILKVVKLVLTKAGYEVTTVEDGKTGLEEAKRDPPDLILLDFIMPRMNGYQVCKALSQDPALAQIPVVLMSAKGEKVGERFVKLLGIVDYISKPFSPEALRSIITATIEKHQGQAGQLVAEAVRGEARSKTLEDALTRLGHQLAQALAAAAPGFPSPLPLSQAVGEVAQAALNPQRLEEILSAFARECPESLEDKRAVLRGDVSVISPAEVLKLIHNQSQTGVLTLIRGSTQVEVVFQGGAISMARGDGLDQNMRLGRFLVDSDQITRQDLELFLKSRQGSKKLLGKQLVQLGFIDEEGLTQALGLQSREYIYEILRWNYGIFRFLATDELPALAKDANLELSVDEILLEGLRRADEWHLIEQEIQALDDIFVKDLGRVARLGKGHLTQEEEQVIDLLDGRNTVRDIIRHSHMGSFDVSRILYRFLSLRFISRRMPPLAV